MGRLQDKRLFLLDMDGTIYLDDRLFDGVTAFLSRIREKGGRYLFLTNNSSKGVEGYIEKLNGMGIATGREDYLTSVDAAIDLLRRRYPGRRCYVQGTRSFYDQLAAAGIPVTCDREDGAEILLSGFDRELTFQKLEDACILLNRGVPFVATNPDWVCPMPAGEVLPDCGSICALLTAASGVKPTYIGKPNRNMVDVISAQTGVPNEQICCVGDRLYTDIAVAVNAGAQSVLVMSGETDEAMLRASDVQPKYVLRDVAELAQILRDGTV